MRKGLIGLIITIVISAAAAAFTYSYITSSNLNPSASITDTLNYIPKYENNLKSWKLKYLKDICIIKSQPCTHTAEITFTTLDSWSEVYQFYKVQMLGYGWQTNSAILTSVPTSAVYISPKNCEADVSKNESVFSRVSSNQNNLKITISCRQSTL